MNKISTVGLVLLALLMPLRDTLAELNIEITRGAGRRIPVAIVPFGWEGSEAQAPYDIDDVIAADLYRSGRFEPIAEADMLQKPTAGIDVDFDDWSTRRRSHRDRQDYADGRQCLQRPVPAF